MPKPVELLVGAPPKDEIAKLRWLLERLKLAEDFCRPYFDRAKRHYRLYRWGSAVDSDKWPYVNRCRTQDILAFVEDSTALMVQTLFAQMPFFSMIPRQTSIAAQKFGMLDFEHIGRQIERAVDYVVSHEDTEYFEETVDLFKGGDIFGNGYQGIFPRKNSILPLIKTIDFWDILPIPAPRRITKAKGVFYREWVTFEDLMGEPAYDQAKVKQIKGKPATSKTDPEKDWHQQLLMEVGMRDYQPEDYDIELIHYLSGGHVVSFADRKQIIRDTTKPVNGIIEKPYPYDHPIVQYKYMPVPLEFFAMGIPEVLEFLQEDDNLIRSARRDNIDLCIQKIIKYRENAGLNFDLVGKFYPAAMWPMPNLQDVEELDMKDVTQSSFAETELRKHEKENALSLFGYARGMTPKHTEQPYTVMKLQQAALNRTDLTVKLTEFGVLQNVAMRIILHLRANCSSGEYESIIGEPDAGFYQLPIEAIRRFYLIKPVGSSVTNIREIRQQQMQFMIQTLAGVSPEMMQMSVTPFRVDYYEAIKRAMEAVDARNIDRILIPQTPQEAEAEQLMSAFMPMAEELSGLAEIPYGEMY